MEPYLGEIRMFGGNFAPAGWAFCDGTLLEIVQNTALFALIGTTYGGDGRTTFALPDLRGRVPVHQGTNQGSIYVAGQPLGEEQVALTVSTMPQHSHVMVASASAPTNAAGPTQLTGQAAAIASYGPGGSGAMSPLAVGADGGGNQPHNNVAPYLCISFIIALQGIFPTHA